VEELFARYGSRIVSTDKLPQSVKLVLLLFESTLLLFDSTLLLFKSSLLL
jgi:hypothetical protein